MKLQTSFVLGTGCKSAPAAGFCHCGLDPQSPEKGVRMTNSKGGLRVKPAMTEILIAQYGASLQLVPKTKEVCNFVY
ncbi:MAG: hypothetical protein LBN27_12020 [Prevotellaceae bacterium]|jgi:hypothetical protein|nr:hypothetical protein [Prevotellaceae bacterium]